ncbi:MAG: FadR family transcriptional regulator [Bacteroidales bacterium]|jgi:GntR family transcriptional repressor for pyruvate dehydrogenase complex|nr:FadR family transcriptional regulator [Bacteroidales bacterium]
MIDLKVEPIEIEKPSDVIIKQIRHLIVSGQLKPGDKLPSERQLTQMFGVGRTYVRDALKKLEVYGILKTLPQSGTVVSGYDINIIENMFADVLKMEDFDFYSLVEIRVLLEMKAADLSAERRSDSDLKEIKKHIDAYIRKAKQNEDAVGEDFSIHRSIAKATQNPVLESLLAILVPDLLKHYRKYGLCVSDYDRPIREHLELYNAIKERDCSKAALLMKKHLENIVVFAQKQKNQKAIAI